MLLACYSHKHISYRIRTIIRKAILARRKRSFCISGLYLIHRSQPPKRFIRVRAKVPDPESTSVSFSCPL
ncbi:hypothetical protein [Wolbachia endosymbiont (group A) of Scambus nigricans]|uniref:hypothetical protein n=1 Tax=Wolbachia endosymbiont (group A) of Scambus nigricans TaxID=2954055 RepID=UPI0022321D4E|nr:hypothetical protein [Wolbachia endosymbiont (group A) of Scambus nigricans]